MLAMAVAMDLASRARSTKTRIETSIGPTDDTLPDSEASRARSTKTRIETSGYLAIQLGLRRLLRRVLREPDPRKQGLKPLLRSNDNHGVLQSSRARSTKTRIETQRSASWPAGVILREPDPRKQGLKPEAVTSGVLLSRLREPDPRKQGLKPLLFVFWLCVVFKLREPDPRKQGLKPKIASFSRAFIARFESQIHENKD